METLHQPPAVHSDRKHAEIKSILSTVAVFLIAPVIALLLTFFVFQSYEVDGPSMETTLHNHDRLIVLKLPQTLSRITKHPYLPKRGDIIVFNQQEAQSEFSQGSNKQLIKRVVGLPNDHIVIKDGQVAIYNTEHPTGFDPDDGPQNSSITKTTDGNVDLLVKENELFVLGDNRANSLDSRYFGTVAIKDVVGKLSVRIFPFGTFEVF